MPIFKTGDMWTEFEKPDTLFVFTANSTVTKDGRLVMGRGIALEVKEHLAGIDAAFGCLIRNQIIPDEYGLLILDYFNNRIGAFQVKRHFSEAASPALIKAAAGKLAVWAGEHPSITVNMNFPGIGYGRLPEEIVRPLLVVLPANVCIWKLR